MQILRRFDYVAQNFGRCMKVYMIITTQILLDPHSEYYRLQPIVTYTVNRDA